MGRLRSVVPDESQSAQSVALQTVASCLLYDLLPGLEVSLIVSNGLLECLS